MAQMVRSLPAMQETWVRFLGWEDPLEKERATHSSTLAWKIPWTEEHGRLHSPWGRKGHDFTSLSLLLLLSCFSCVQLCVTPETAAHEAALSLGFSGKNTGVGCHFLLQCIKVKRESEVAQSCPTLSNPMDCSLPGSSVHGIFQARVLEWAAIIADCILLIN